MADDRIWLNRFAGQAVALTGLDAVLYKDFEDVWQVRIAEDERIQAFAASLTETRAIAKSAKQFIVFWVKILKVYPVEMGKL